MMLGPRLQAIAERVLPGLAVADLCCDHAQLAAALVVRGTVPRAIAGDVAEGPLAAAAPLIAELGIADRVALRRGDGAAVLAAHEVATVVIAGVGAPLAERIIAEAAASGRLGGVRRLIVQPNHGFPKLGLVRAGLGELGWRLVDEVIARDKGRLYAILVAEPGAAELDEADVQLGPILRTRTDPLTRAWFEHERRRVERALAGMGRGHVDAGLEGLYRYYLALSGEFAPSVSG